MSLSLKGCCKLLSADEEKGVEMCITTTKKKREVDYRIRETAEMFSSYEDLVKAYKKTESYKEALSKVI